MKQAFCAFILLAASPGSPAAANVDPSVPERGPEVTQLLLDDTPNPVNRVGFFSSA